MVTCCNVFPLSKLVDETINSAIEDSIFPGATILIGNENSVLYKNAYGNFTYDKNSPKVENNSIFDLASVTKAFGTNFCVMKLVDENKLDINKPVSFYIPDFATNGKENVKVIDLLIHESGLQAYYTPSKNEDKCQSQPKNIQFRSPFYERSKS